MLVLQKMISKNISVDKNIPLLSQNPLFGKVSQKELKTLLGDSSIIEAEKGENIFEAGSRADFVFIVLSGALKLFRLHPDGKERIIHFLLQGEIAGAVVAMNQAFYPISAATLDYSRILKIKSDVFQKLFLAHQELGPVLAGQIGERMNQAHNDRLMVFDSVEKRLAACILDLLERFQKKTGPTSRIPLPLTRQDLANRIGSTVETVIRTLSEWSKKGWVITQDKYIEIADKKSVEKIGSEEN